MTGPLGVLWLGEYTVPECAWIVQIARSFGATTR